MRRLLVVLLSIVWIGGGVASAQYDPEAKKILDAMSDKYQSIPSFTAKVKYTLENVEDDINESFDGDIGVKGEKFRLLSADQEVIINNGNVWTYLEAENEVNIDTYDPEEGDVTPSNVYSLYKEGYKYILFGEETIGGKAHHVVDLAPEKKESDYFRIRLVISKSNSVLSKFTMYSNSGNRYIYEITDFNPNANLQDSYFVFNESEYEGVEVIDLRIDN